MNGRISSRPRKQQRLDSSFLEGGQKRQSERVDTLHQISVDTIEFRTYADLVEQMVERGSLAFGPEIDARYYVECFSAKEMQRLFYVFCHSETSKGLGDGRVFSSTTRA